MEHRLYNVDCQKFYILSVSIYEDSSRASKGAAASSWTKSSSKRSCSSDILFRTISIWFFAFARHSWSAPFGRSYFVLAETRQITIGITLHISLLMSGFNWTTFLGIQPMAFICSDADLPEFCMVWTWLRPESVSGALRSSIPFWRAEHIYGYPIQPLEMELAWMHKPRPQTYHRLSRGILAAL